MDHFPFSLPAYTGLTHPLPILPIWAFVSSKGVDFIYCLRKPKLYQPTHSPLTPFPQSFCASNFSHEFSKDKWLNSFVNRTVIVPYISSSHLSG